MKRCKGLRIRFRLRHSSISNPSDALPTSQLILQPFRCFTYVVGTSPTSPDELPMSLWWCLIYPWWFCNLQWLRPAGLYERCKLALELKRLKTPGVGLQMWMHSNCWPAAQWTSRVCPHRGASDCYRTLLNRWKALDCGGIICTFWDFCIDSVLHFTKWL